MTVQQQKRGTASEWSAAVNPLSAGELGYDTTNKVLKIGDGTTLWASLLPINKSFYYVTAQQTMTLNTTEQDLFASPSRLPLLANSIYEFTIQCTISTSTPGSARNFDFGFYQTGMTAFSNIRYIWSYGTRGTGVSYSTSTFTGSSNVTGALVTFSSSSTDPVLMFTIQGTLTTGNGSSDFRPRIKFSNTDTTRNLLSNSFIKVDYLGPSTATNTGGWI
jgi:hypothetical protein